MPWRRSILSLVVALACPQLLLAQTTPASPTTTPVPKTRPSPPPPVKPSDVEGVERLLAARREYQTSLELLRQHYISAGDIEKARWAEDELISFHRVSKQAYRLDLDVLAHADPDAADPRAGSRPRRPSGPGGPDGPDRSAGTARACRPPTSCDRPKIRCDDCRRTTSISITPIATIRACRWKTSPER